MIDEQSLRTLPYISFIIKPTLTCNRSCKHCYHLECENDDTFMDEHTLKNAIKLAADFKGNVSFTWHGGEPSLMPLAFYKKARHHQKKLIDKNVKYSNMFRTNGIDVSKKYAKSLLDLDFTIMVSTERPYGSLLRNGCIDSETAELTLCDNKCLNIATTIAKEDVQNMYSIYKQHAHDSAIISFRPVSLLGNAFLNEDLVPDPNKYSMELIRIFDDWCKDTGSSAVIQPIQRYLDFISGNLQTGDCENLDCPGTTVCIYPNGDIYPCGKGCSRRYLIGNVNMDLHPSDIWDSEGFRRFCKDHGEQTKECAGCDLIDVCKGGCMIDTSETGSTCNSPSCIIFRTVYMHMFEYIMNIVDSQEDVSPYNRYIRDTVCSILLDPKRIQN